MSQLVYFTCSLVDRLNPSVVESFALGVIMFVYTNMSIKTPWL